MSQNTTRSDRQSYPPPRRMHWYCRREGGYARGFAAEPLIKMTGKSLGQRLCHRYGDSDSETMLTFVRPIYHRHCVAADLRNWSLAKGAEIFIPQQRCAKGLHFASPLFVRTTALHFWKTSVVRIHNKLIAVPGSTLTPSDTVVGIFALATKHHNYSEMGTSSHSDIRSNLKINNAVSKHLVLSRSF